MKSENPAIKMLPGFITGVRVRCGKSNCQCSRGARHLAYYHVMYRSGVRVRKYVRHGQVPHMRAACKAHKDLQDQLRAGRAEYRRTLSRMRELLGIIRDE
jgi:hypothetical protein